MLIALALAHFGLRRVKAGESWSDRILKAIMEKQQAGAPTPHDPPRFKKDVDEFPQLPENTSKGHAAWNDWPWKLHRINGQKYELYNLEKDPMEATDLSRNPEYAERFNGMKSELNTWMTSVVRSLNGKDYAR